MDKQAKIVEMLRMLKVESELRKSVGQWVNKKLEEKGED